MIRGPLFQLPDVPRVQRPSVTVPHRSGPALLRTLALLLACAAHLAHAAGAVESVAAAPAVASPATAAPALPLPPSIAYGELFRDVQTQNLFHDSKTFPDMEPDAAPADIVARYRRERHRPGFDLRTFVTRHFVLPQRPPTNVPAATGRDVRDHIDALWDTLTRSPDTRLARHSSLLPLPNPYVVPGDRFDEVYYWDSYFILLGLEASGRHDLTRDEVDNFATLIDRYGHIPNGNRSYYLSRSQPPFFSLMVDLVAAREGDGAYLRYLPELEREYDYWMDGASDLGSGEAHRRVVRLSDGAVLNRYWDDRAAPRDESYSEDLATAARSKRPSADLWRNLRAAGESGWDFSSRWFADGQSLDTIHVTSLLPADLNSVMYHLERTLAHAYGIRGDRARAENMHLRSRQRQAAINRLLWDPVTGSYGDYDFRRKRLTGMVTAATAYPLFFGLAPQERAEAVAATIRERLLYPGGLATTTRTSGQQWDRPNGWAPLQYLAVVGLEQYGEAELARTIATRWIDKNLDSYRRTGKLVEKYDIEAGRTAGGGEYVLQEGFGWTNGVLRALLARYPQAATQSSEASARAGTQPATQ
jgi:alpha,alpha-trehalase